MKKNNINLFISVASFSILFAFSGYSQSADTLRAPLAGRSSSPFLYLDHWAYTYIQLLLDRGYLKDLFYSVKPYQRMDVAAGLAAIQTDQLSDPEKYWLTVLKEEFAGEIRRLEATGADRDQLKLGSTVQEKLYSNENHFHSDFFINPEVNYTSTNISVAARGRIDRGLLRDTTYSGRRSKYFAARLEDGYGLFQFGKVSFLIGRVAQNWSPFIHQSLILSDNSYTYDQIGLMVTTRHVSIRSVFAKLNPIQSADRFYSAHRLDVKFSSGVNLGFSESVVFGGVNQGVELAYLNPFTIFANAQLNDHKEANETLAFDFFIPANKTNFKGQILIDDFILDGPSKPPPNRKTSPDRLAYIFGIQRNDLLVSNSQISVTYERVGSYTYNVKQKRPWQAYTYFDRGLGGSMNDHDTWRLNWKYFPLPKFIFNMDIELARIGSRNLQSNDFEDSTFLKLAFPSGVAARSLNINCGALYQHSKNVFLEGLVGFTKVMNYNHVPDRNRKFFNFELRLQWTLSGNSRAN